MLDVGYINNEGISVSGISSQVRFVASSSSSASSAITQLQDLDMVVPSIRVDVDLDRAILEYRSTKTGEVKRQFPTEEQLRAFVEAERLTATRQAEAHKQKVDQAIEAELSHSSSSGGSSYVASSSTSKSISSSTSSASSTPAVSVGSDSYSSSGISISFSSGKDSSGSVLV
jgi:hypothetical protein